MKRASKNNKMMILETPDFALRPKEITMVRDIINDQFDIESFHREYFMSDILKKFE